MPHLYYAMTMPGLETLAFSEVRAIQQEAEQVKFARGIALFRTDISPVSLLALRTSEDVFCALAHIAKLGRGQDALRVLHSATLHTDLATAIQLWRQAHHGARPRTWRVVSQMSGSYDFRRIDAGRSVEAALRRAMPRQMHHVEDQADLEIWLWLGGNDVFIGLRLSDATMRHRRYKQEHLPASLRPTVAAAMSKLAHPTETDIVLDPLCGAGTILVERSLMAPCAEILGGDIREPAVVMARRNASAAGVKVDWHQWDACALPLDAQQVTRIITNLPFGKQIGTHEENRTLYIDLLREFERVLTSDGLLVTLTSEDQLWNTLLRDQGWHITKKIVLVVLGQPASIFVAERGH